MQEPNEIDPEFEGEVFAVEEPAEPEAEPAENSEEEQTND